MSVRSTATRQNLTRIAAATALAASLSAGSTPASAKPTDAPLRHQTTHHTDDMVRGVTMTSRSSTEARAALTDEAKAERTKPEAEALDEAKNKAAATAREAARKNTQPTYPNNLDGWIREARAIMAKHGIPGSYDGIKRNIMRESRGNPKAVNDWDSNAQKGTPSKGLLQTIQPTFDAYHVKGTAHKVTDPVANIVAACNYAADRYGSMDNVDSAY